MKILQLCKKFPFPVKDGESIAVTYLSQALAEQGCEISLLCFNTSKHYVDVDRIPDSFDHYQEIRTVQLDNELSSWDAFKNLFSSKSYHVSRFESNEFATELQSMLQENDYDVIQLETLYLAPYVPVIRKHSDAMVVMRAHNVEHEIWERLQQNIKFLPKKWYLRYLTSKLKKFELNRLEDYDFLIPISEADLSKFRELGYANGAAAIPIGLDLDTYSPRMMSTKSSMSMSFIGSLDWMPNLEGLSWFIDEVWPDLSEEFQDLSLHIAGRRSPDYLNRLSSHRLVVHGEVEDAKEFLNEHPIMVVPLLSGSGMRAKILEAMALGRVVLTTTLGLEGIPAVPGKDVLVADRSEEFIHQLRRLKEDPLLVQELSENARQFVENRFSHIELAKNLADSLMTYRTKKSSSISKPIVSA